jgi:hypothetical protein
VTVRIKRYADAGMTQTLGHDFRVHASLEHETRMRMAQVMEPDMRKTSSLKQACKAATNRLHRLSCR